MTTTEDLELDVTFEPAVRLSRDTTRAVRKLITHSDYLDRKGRHVEAAAFREAADLVLELQGRDS